MRLRLTKRKRSSKRRKRTCKRSIRERESV